MNKLQTALAIAFVAMLIVTRASNWPGFEILTLAIGLAYVASVLIRA